MSKEKEKSSELGKDDSSINSPPSLSNEQLLSLLHLPENFISNTTIGNEGSFFKALSESLNMTLNTNIYSEAALRDIYNDKKEKQKIASSSIHVGEIIEQGRILCSELSLQGIYLIKIINKEGKLTTSHFLITAKGVKNIEGNVFSSFYKNNPVIIGNKDDLYFLPLLVKSLPKVDNLHEISNEGDEYFQEDDPSQPLIAKDEKYSAMTLWKDILQVNSKLRRWFLRNDFFEKLIILPFLDEFPARGSFIEKLKDRLNYLCCANSLPQINAKGLQAANLSSSFSQGVSLVTNMLWPLTFSGLFLHDIIVYFSQPENRYGNEFWKILLGISDNEATLSSHLGSDLATEYQFWVPPAFLAAAPIVAGLLFMVMNRRWIRPIGEISDYSFGATEEKRLTTDIVEDFREKLAYEWTGYTILRLLHAILWDARLEKKDRIGFVYSEGGASEIVSIAKENFNSLKRLFAIHALAEIADSFSVNNLELLPLSDREHFKKIGEHAENALQGLSHIFAKYKYWTLAGEKKWPAHLFWLFTLYITYTQTRLFELWILKLIEAFEYLVTNKKCDGDAEVEVYLKEFGNYFCTVCGDWPFVYVNDVFSAQGCLDGLMHSNLSPQEILAKLPRFKKHSNFTGIDFPRWTNWTTSNFEDFLDQIVPMQKQIITFNLSSPVFNADGVNNDRVSTLANFLQRVTVKQLDLSNQGLGSINIASLFSHPAIPMTYINLNGNALDDDIASTIRYVINNNVIQTLIIANNEFSDLGMNIICNGTTVPSSLVYLDVSGNPIGSLQAFQQLLSNYSSLRTLDVSNTDLSQANLAKFIQVTHNSSLILFKASNTNFYDGQVLSATPYFANTSIQIINLNYNPLTDASVSVFVNGLKNTIIKGVYLGYTAITDVSYRIIGKTLNQTQITDIDLSATYPSNDGVTALGDGIAHSDIENINLSNNQLGDENALIIAESIATNQNTIKSVDLSSNQLTDQSGVRLAEVSANNGLKVVNLSNNQLTNQTAQAFAKGLPTSQLENIDLSQNQISGDGAVALFENAKNSTLQEVNLSDNPLGVTTSTGLNIALSLITPIPHPNSLTQPKLSEDEARALYQAKPASNITSIGLENTGIGNSDAIAICHAVSPPQVDINQIRLERNTLINPEIVDPKNCVIGAEENTRAKKSHKQINTKALRSSKNLHQKPSSVRTSNIAQTRYLRAGQQPAIAIQSTMMGMVSGAIPITLAIIVLLILLALLYRALKPLVSNLAGRFGTFRSQPSRSLDSPTSSFSDQNFIVSKEQQHARTSIRL